MGLEPDRVQAVLEDVIKKLPLPQGSAKASKFEEADGALACAGFLLARALTGEPQATYAASL